MANFFVVAVEDIASNSGWICARVVRPLFRRDSFCGVVTALQSYSSPLAPSGVVLKPGFRDGKLVLSRAAFPDLACRRTTPSFKATS